MVRELPGHVVEVDVTVTGAIDAQQPASAIGRQCRAEPLGEAGPSGARGSRDEKGERLSRIFLADETLDGTADIVRRLQRSRSRLGDADQAFLDWEAAKPAASAFKLQSVSLMLRVQTAELDES